MLNFGFTKLAYAIEDAYAMIAIQLYMSCYLPTPCREVSFLLLYHAS
jgi:hypothetical protein